ncbi:MAG: dTMP kinase [Gemmatimonadetes bacterium]|nr:dTMP kinase [Gemmatimonadota bacterium]
MAIEGGEGVGKTTQLGLLSRRVEACGFEVCTVREPGGTPIGEEVRRILARSQTGSIAPRAELMLILAARAALIGEVVAPALAEGRWVLSDRSSLSSLAYQGYGRGLPLEEVELLDRSATGGLGPDICIVLDLPAGEGIARHRRGRKRLDRFESETDGFLERVRLGYLELAKSRAEAVLVPADGTVDLVAERVWREVCAAFPTGLADPRDSDSGRVSPVR